MAPLQLKGCTRTPSLCSTTTPSGASERRHCQCLCSPLRPRSRAGVFPAARVPPRSPSPGAPLLRVLVLRYEASSHVRVDSLPADPFWGPSSLRHQAYVFVVLLSSYMRGEVRVNQGVRTCLPGRDCVPSPCAIVSHLSTVTAGTWKWTPSYVARPVVYGVPDAVHGCPTFPAQLRLRR